MFFQIEYLFYFCNQQRLDEASQTIESVRRMYEEEQASTRSLKKELASYQRQMKEARLAKEEAKIVRTKLQELQAIENLVKGKHSVVSD